MFKIIIKSLFKSVQIVLGSLIIILVALLLLGHFGYINTVKPFVVQSGSMEPTVPTASVIFSLPEDSYNQGDIITFHPDGNTKKTVTHRIEFKLYPDGVNEAPLFITAGDANEEVDNWKVRQEDIIGKEVITVPYVGYLVDFAKKPQGFILLVIVPATIVIYEELKSLFLEIKDNIKKIRKSISILKKPSVFDLKVKKENTNNSVNMKIRKFSPPKIWAIIPVVGAGIFMIAFSASYFTDIEESIGNIFRAGTWGTPTVSPSPSPSITPPPQTADTLVINEVMPLSDCKVGNDTAQWIEVYNGYSTTINLQNFKITDGSNTVALVNAGNIDIPPSGFALLSHDNSIWNKCYSNNGVITANLGTGNLNLNTGALELLDSSDNVIDHVQWDNRNGYIDETPSINQSIERNPLGRDTAGGSDWNPEDFVVQTPPRPGQ